VLLLALAALLYGMAMHAARACVPAATPVGSLAAEAERCHGDPAASVAEAACEAHCRTDVQSSRVDVSFDLPAAAPQDVVVAHAPLTLLEPVALAQSPPRRDTGPPLHILLHRLLR
jgi:hypothetical protein